MVVAGGCRGGGDDGDGNNRRGMASGAAVGINALGIGMIPNCFKPGTCRSAYLSEGLRMNYSVKLQRSGTCQIKRKQCCAACQVLTSAGAGCGRTR